MGTPTTKTEILLSTEKELIKQYLELDAFGRPGILYTAVTNAKTGAPCLICEFIYEADDNTILRGKKDGYSTWNESFVPDSDFTVDEVYISKTQQIQTIEKNLTKQYQQIDGQMRPVRIYEAIVSAKTGDPCLVTEYIYQNPTSSVIKGKKESYAQWDESFVPDSLFTVSF